MHDAALAVLSRYGWDITLDKKLLQLMGTEWGRQCVDTNIWVKCLLADAERYKAAGMNYLIIDDCRFKNEFEVLKGPDAVLIRLECNEEARKVRCSQWRDTTTHQSEIDLDDWVDRFDLVINTETTTPEDTLKRALEFINGKTS